MIGVGPLTADAMNRILAALGLPEDALSGTISAPHWEKVLLEIIRRLPKETQGGAK